MQKLFYNDTLLSDLITREETENYREGIKSAENMLENRTGPRKDFLGWLKLPEMITEAELDDIISKADSLREKANFLICLGIGGSYLGAKSGIDFLSHSFEDLRKYRILFSGHHLNSDYMAELL